MFCKYCGTKMDDNATVCPSCGKKVEKPASTPGQTGGHGLDTMFIQDRGVVDHVTPGKHVDDTGKKQIRTKKEKKPKKKMSKGKKVLVGFCVAGGVVVVLAIAGTVFYFTSPARAVAVQYQNGEYSEITSTYNSEIKGNFIQEMLLEKTMASEVSDVIDGFKSGDLEYTVAQEKLTMAQRLNISGLKKEIEDSLEMLDSLNSSITAYQKAEEYYAAGQYSQAIVEYSNVIEEDENYEDAQSKMEECVDTYKEDILSKTEAPAEYEEYENAISLVQVALDVLPDDQELKDRESELQKNYAAKLKSDALTNGTQYISDGKYEEIFGLLDNALEANPNDSELTNLYNTAVTSFEEYAATTVDGYIQNEQFDEATAFLSDAEDILPDSQKLTELRSTVQDAVPVNLSDMKISESDNFEKVDELGVKEDVIGNIYSPENLYKMTDDAGRESYATYYVNNKYKRIKGRIAVADDSEKATGQFTIYGDNGKILYNSGEMSRTTAPIDVDVDISGAQWITVGVTNPDWGYFRLLVSDFVLYK